jgi:energy-coupling factor transport system substrate-specific component
MIKSIKKDFPISTFALIPLAIAINLVIGELVVLLKLPIFLDSIGTVLVAVLCGPWAGALTGIITNVVGGLVLDPGFLPFAPVAGIIGFVAGWLAIAGWYHSWWKTALAGVLITVALSLVASPIKIAVYGGITPNAVGAVTSFLLATGQDFLTSVLTVVVVSNLVDKILTNFIVVLILKWLPARFLNRFPRSENIRGAEVLSTQQAI